MGSGLSMHIHANAHDWGQMPMFEGKIGQAFRSFTSKPWQLVNDLKVRRNQPQWSNFAFKVRSSQSHCGSYRSRRGRCQATDGDPYCIFWL